MASFEFSLDEFSLDLGKFFPHGILQEDENLAIDMIKAGQKVMLKAIKDAAKKHVVTGALAQSPKATWPRINKDGVAVGYVRFYGDDENGMANWAKAMWIEYGTVKQDAAPFVRPAIQSCQNSINDAMQKVFDERIKG